MRDENFKEDLELGKNSLKELWDLEVLDFEDGSKTYRVFSSSYMEIFKINDGENVYAKRDAEYIVKMHNHLMKTVNSSLRDKKLSDKP